MMRRFLIFRRIMRIDKFLKVSRIIKRRTVANEACDASHVSVNGRQVKASYDVKEGDIIEITFGEKKLKVKVYANSLSVSNCSSRMLSPFSSSTSTVL